MVLRATERDPEGVCAGYVRTTLSSGSTPARVARHGTGIAGSVLACPTASAQSQPHKTVLTVQWSSEDFPTNPIVDGAIRRVLSSRSNVPIDYYAEYLESDRFPAAEASAALRDYIRAKYRGRQIDLVIAISEPALQFVLRHRHELFPNAPGRVYRRQPRHLPTFAVRVQDSPGYLATSRSARRSSSPEAAPVHGTGACRRAGRVPRIFWTGSGLN